MINFKNLIDKVDFELVWKEYLTFYPDMLHLKEEYSKIFNTLLYKEPKENIENMVIHIDRQDYEESDDKGDCLLGLTDNELRDIGYRVHGKNDSAEWKGYWDISAADRGSWLGYYIHDKVIKFLSFEQIVALCLYEMTWYGISENEIIKWKDNLDKDIEE